MPLYMSSFGYKSEVWAGLIRSPENREEAVGRVLEELREASFAGEVHTPEEALQLATRIQRGGAK